MPVTPQVDAAGSGAQHHPATTEFKVSLDDFQINEGLSQKKKQKSVVILSTYQLGIFLLLCMICMCDYVCSAHVYDHRTTLWSPFSPPTLMKVLRDQTQVIRPCAATFIPSEPSCQPPI